MMPAASGATFFAHSLLPCCRSTTNAPHTRPAHDAPSPSRCVCPIFRPPPPLTLPYSPLPAPALPPLQMVTIVDPHIKRDPAWRTFKEAEEKGLYVKNKDGADFDGCGGMRVAPPARPPACLRATNPCMGPPP